MTTKSRELTDKAADHVAGGLAGGVILSPNRSPAVAATSQAAGFDFPRPPPL